ncbi:hypothetical protein ACOME3_008933 [Neoechinorhynchus agilis]
MSFKEELTEIGPLPGTRLQRGQCGVGMVVSVDCIASRKVILHAKSMLLGMAHRGACIRNSGDGAGILLRIPDAMYRSLLRRSYSVDLPTFGEYATGLFFMTAANAEYCKQRFNEIASEHFVTVICWRVVPVNHDAIGVGARQDEPYILQAFLILSKSDLYLERQVLILRKRSSDEIIKATNRFYICSLSTRTIVYKGRFDANQLWHYYIDLESPEFVSPFAIVHARFATNTYPTWELAQPFRVMAHNGEINTLRGNCNHMRSREGMLASDRFKHMSDIYPILESNMGEVSDTSLLDNAAEFIHKAGRKNLAETLFLLIPEGFLGTDDLIPTGDSDKARIARYVRYNSFAMEPWDGPAAVMFTDGRICGSLVDRNGLRPVRFKVVDDRNERMLFVANEAGLVDVDESAVTCKGKLGSGQMIMVDLQSRKLILNDELKIAMCKDVQTEAYLSRAITLKTLREKLEKHLLPGHLSDTGIFEQPPSPITGVDDGSRSGNGKHQKEPRKDLRVVSEFKETDRRLILFAYNTESFNEVLLPMIRDTREATASMGDDTPLACLSQCSRLSYDYFQQKFAQGTNPPLDSIRERIVMSLGCPIGPEHDLLNPSSEQCRRLWLDSPILSPIELEVIKLSAHHGLRSKVINMLFSRQSGSNGLRDTLPIICKECLEAVNQGYNMIILSDRCVGPGSVPVSALLTVGAVHQFLVNEKSRMKCSLFVESGEARDVHQMAVLLSFGADAICPYMVFDLIAQYRRMGVFPSSYENTSDKHFDRYRFTCIQGIFHILAKMGISTLQSYKGAQSFEIVGLADDVVEQCFSGTTSRLGGVSYELLASEVLHRHTLAYSDRVGDIRFAQNYGLFNWRDGGEYHLYAPKAIRLLQKAVRQNDSAAYNEFSKFHSELSRCCTLSGQLDFAFPSKDKKPLTLDEVEDVESILSRFSSAAISFGSVSIEAFNTIGRAMAKLNAKSNCGEGGQPATGYSSYIKQVASGRFGVSLQYISEAAELQIKIGQGSKPGEGGELPWFKMDEVVAKTRNCTSWVADRSPAPHHDVYSVEDLSQLVYDLRSVNPDASIGLKLVSSHGVGVIATGGVKSGINSVTISGHGGGTGGSAWTGIRNAGLPWEFGINETHRVFVTNNIRDKVSLEVDGQLQTGVDVVKAALLGADKFSFGTCVMIAIGCTMCKKCHLNTCHVGIATQDKELRRRYTGQEDAIINYFNFVANEVRQIMCSLGVKFFSDLIGRTDLLRLNPALSNKALHLDFSFFLNPPPVSTLPPQTPAKFNVKDRLEYTLLDRIKTELLQSKGRSTNCNFSLKIKNTDRSFGALISGYIVGLGLDSKLADNSINIHLEGTGGQSFGAFLAKGITFTIYGEVNDFAGKGLSGGKIVVRPPLSSTFKSNENIIAGNVLLYGAISGCAYFSGMVGERFCVRNSGAVAVCEGCGDHGCEYMTSGIAVILGKVGRNFAAGMAGGVI